MKRACHLENKIRKPLVQLQEMIAFRAFLHREMCEKASDEDFKSCLEIQERRDLVTKRANETLRMNRAEIEAALRPCPPVDVRAEMIEKCSVRVKWRLGPSNLNGDVITACTISLYSLQGWTRRAEDGHWLANYEGKNICNSASATLLLGLERCGMMNDSIEPVYSVCVALEGNMNTKIKKNILTATQKWDEVLPYYECVVPVRSVRAWSSRIGISLSMYVNPITFSCLQEIITSITRIILASLNQCLQKITQTQRSNAHSNITKTLTPTLEHRYRL